MVKKLAVLTSGGDAPGMNAAIRSVVRSAIYGGAEIFGIEQGFQGLLDGHFIPLGCRSVGGILLRGGTMLRTARSEEFKTEQGVAKAAKMLAERNIDALVVIGGDGSFRGAKDLAEAGIKVAGVPATIDNDMGGTDFTIGFDTACNTAVSCIAHLRDTASSHDRLFIVEVMGRHSGAIALHTGVACGAEYVLIPERPSEIGHIIQRLQKSREGNKSHSIIVTAEGACSGHDLAEKLKGACGYDPRVVVLGHLLRGGQPTCADSLLGARLGYEAVARLLSGESNFMVGGSQGEIVTSPIERAWEDKSAVKEGLIKLLSVLSI